MTNTTLVWQHVVDDRWNEAQSLINEMEREEIAAIAKLAGQLSAVAWRVHDRKLGLGDVS